MKAWSPGSNHFYPEGIGTINNKKGCEEANPCYLHTLFIL